MKMEVLKIESVADKKFISVELSDLDGSSNFVKSMPFRGEIVSQFPANGCIYVDVRLDKDTLLEEGDVVDVVSGVEKCTKTAAQEMDELAKAFASQIHKNGVHRFTYAQAYRHVLQTRPDLYRRYRAENNGQC
jgi:hypothetical protein